MLLLLLTRSRRKVNRNRVLLNISVLVMLVVWTGANFTNVLAQTQENNSISGPSSALGLELTPAIFEQVLKPGQTVMQQIVLSNITTEHQLVRSRSVAFTPNEQKLDETQNSRFNAAGWATIEDPDFILAPGQKRAVLVKLSVPEQAEPGGHYLRIVFDILLQNNSPTASSSTVNLPKLITTGMIVVPGEIKEGLLYGREIVPPFFLFGATTLLDIPIKNIGNVHSLPTTNIQIKNWYGHDIDSIPVPARLIMPNTVRTFNEKWPNRLPGIYRLTFTTTYGTPSQSITTGQIYVLVLPSLYSCILAIGIITVVLMAVRYRKRFRAALRAFRLGQHKEPSKTTEETKSMNKKT